mgnify:CR=1 FL=1
MASADIGAAVTTTWPRTIRGAGWCVGTPAPGAFVRITPVTGNPIHHWSPQLELPAGDVGEVVVDDTVASRSYAAFDQKLYDGLGTEEIKGRKGIPPKEQLMDRMGSTELAANQFRMTQTRDKLSRERVHDQETAIETHEQVGKEVRAAIERIGGTPPERLPAAEHIKAVERRLKGAKPKGALKQEGDEK